jgi:HEAT repeat protein
MKLQEHASLVLALLVVASGCGGGREYRGPAGQNSKSAAQIRMPKAKEPPAPPPRADVTLDKGLAEIARREVSEALRSSDALVRGQALEALRYSPDAEARQQIIAAFDDPWRGVRFGAAMMAGELQIQEARPALLRLAEDPDPNVAVGVRFALHKLGDKTRTRDLEKFAVSSDAQVRANVATALGLLGERSASKILNVLRLDLDPFVRQQATEAMWRLGDQTALRSLVTLTSSGYADDRIRGLLALAAPGRNIVRGHVRGLLAGDDVQPEVALVAARAMGMIGSDEGYKIALDGAKSRDPQQRFLAALALGAIGRPDAQDELRRLMADSQPNVQLAAASAVLQLNKGRA